MTLRAAKVLLVFGVAVFYSLVVLNNITDYNSNYLFVRHVMMMDSTFSGNHGMWRAINSAALHTALYLSIVAWEALTMILCWWGGARLVKALHGTVADVAGRVSERGSGVVFDVAVEELERAGCGVPHVHGDRNCTVVSRTAGCGRAALACRARSSFIARTQ
jgi:hypothetical protein